MSALSSLADRLRVLRSVFARASFRQTGAESLVRFLTWQLWKRLPGASPITISLATGRRLRAYPDCDVSQDCFTFGGHHFYEVRHLQRTLQPDAMMIDVGANVGSIALLLSPPVTDAILIEPSGWAVSRLGENLRLNELPFEVVQSVASAMDGEIAFDEVGPGKSTGRVVASPDLKSGENPHLIESVRIDTVTRDRGIDRLDLLKIDTEGHELEVLDGAQESICGLHPGVVMFERLQRLDLDRVARLLNTLGYQMYALDHDGNRCSVHAARAHPGISNLFAAPKTI